MRRFLLGMITLMLLATTPTGGQMVDTVCASGCTYDNGQLQQALNQVSCGGEILLQENTVYDGEFILRDRGDCSANPITLRTGVDANGAVLSASLFPADGIRITPAYSSVLAKLRTSGNNRPALRTVSPGDTGEGCAAPPCVARGYIIKWLEVVANSWAGGSLMILGSNHPSVDSVLVNGDTQNELGEVPGPLVVDQVYFRGDPVKGQKRGLFISAKNVTIKNSYIRDIKAMGSDGQGISIINTPGPVTITNNYIEGHSQNILTGGDSVRMSYSASVLSSPAPTTTSAAISNTNALQVNQWVSFRVAGAKKSTQITGINGTDVTFSPALPAVPDVPGGVVWSQVVSDLTVTKNHLYKPPAWRDPIVPIPTGVSAGGSTTGGSLAAGTYYYRIAARIPVAQGDTAMSIASPEVSGSVTSGSTGSVTVSWTAVPNATEYRVYGRTSGSQSTYFTTSSTSFTDTGQSGASGTPPESGNVWTVKTNFELKECDRCLIEGNVIDYMWTSPHNSGGYAMWLKVVNQNGDADSAVTRHVTLRNNLIRHTASAANFTFHDVEQNNKPSGVMEDFTIEHNLFYDLGSHWGSGGRTFLTNVGTSAAALVRSARGFTINHNTIIQSSGGHFWYMNQHASGQHWPIENAVFTNNMMRRLSGGLVSAGTGTQPVEGNESWATGTTGTSIFAKNVIADATCSIYPNSANNYCPTSTEWEAEFVDYAGDNYRLSAGSPYKNAGTDGKDLGADIDAIEALTAIALSGDDSGNQPPTANPGGPYSGPSLQAIQFDGSLSSDADGTITAYNWNWGDGTSDSTGVAPTHEYARPDVYTVTLTVTDNNGTQASANTTATVSNRSPVADAGGPYSGAPGAALAVNGGSSSDADGTIVEYRWNWGDGSSDFVSSSSTASHTYATADSYTVSLTVTDDLGATSTDSTTATISSASAPELVIYAAEVETIAGSWSVTSDATAAGGSKLATPDAGWSTTSAPLANPTDYFETTFDARANTDYRIWLRLAATADSKWNDSVWAQFSGSVDSSGSPIYRIGTTTGLLVNLAMSDCSSTCSLNGWGWQDTAYWLASQTTTIRFASAGPQTIRVQVREDGVQIDQIVISPAQFTATSPGPTGGDTTILSKPLTNIVVYGADVPSLNGAWQLVSDASAAGGSRLSTSDGGFETLANPLASPTHYVEVTVQAQAHMDYRLWLRLNALNDSKWNDSVWAQFSNVTAGGSQRYQIGTTSGLLINLATSDCTGSCSLNGWGWQHSAYWLDESQQPTVLRFPTTGSHTIRLQLREDGVSLDQLVLSPGNYLDTAPGAAGGDSTIVPQP